MSLSDRPLWTLGVILVGSFLLLVVEHRRLAGSRQPAGVGETPVRNKEKVFSEIDDENLKFGVPEELAGGPWQW